MTHLFQTNPKFKDSQKIIRYNQETLRNILNEQTEMITKALERISKPENFAKLLLTDENLKLYFHHILAKKPLAFYAHSIRVREVWIGNLPQGMENEQEQKKFKMFLTRYGPIDNIDFFTKNQNFAFVRFHYAESAKRCIDEQDFIIKTMNCQIRMSFSDCLKRFNIVGDDPGVQDNDANLTSIVFISLNMGSLLPEPHFFREKLREFGNIKRTLYRPTINEQLRPFVLLEMETKEQAKHIRRFFGFEDRDGRRKMTFGEKKVEVNIVLKPNVLGNLQDLILPHLQAVNADVSIAEIGISLERPPATADSGKA